jgi:PKD repeat protein
LQNNGNQILWQPNQSAHIAVEGTDQNSCSNSDSVSIYVEHAPSIQIQTPNPQICIGDQTQLNISGGVQYAWFPQTGLNTSTSANPIASPTQTTTYTIESFSQAGCKSDTSLLVQVNNIPNVSASINLNQICIGESVQLQANGASSFAWNNSLNSNTNTLQTFTDQPTANISYFLEGTDNNGCVGKDTIQLTVHQLPNVQIATSSNQICLGESVSFSGSGATSYIWKKNNQQISSGSSFSDNPVSNQSYTLIGTDMNACVDSQAVSVTVHALPTIASTQSHVQICYGDSSLTSVSGATNYQWKLSNNSVHSGPTNYLKSLISGQYTVIGTSSFGCQDSIHIPITVHSLPNVSASTSNANLCLGQSTQITANGAQSYQWSPAINLNNTNSNLVTSTPTSDITYYVNGIDSNGCSSSDSIKLFVSNQLNIQVAASNTSICNGDTVSLQASGANSYQWTQANGLLSNSGNQVYAKPNLPTQFIVTGTDTNGCVSTQSIQINVHSLPNVSVSSLDNYVCPQDSTTLSSSGASSYLWTDLTNGTQHNAPTWQVSPTINTQYRVVGTDVNGCQSEALISIDAAPTPPLQISLSDDSICIGENIQLLASGANNYIWNDQISTYTGQSLSQAPQQNTWYKVTASNSFGCQAIDSAEVHVLALPSFSLSQNSIDLCYGDSAQVQLTGNANYTASPYNGIQISGNSISVNTLSDQIYTIIATNSFGCQSSKNLQVNSRPLPNPDFQLDSIICINNAYNINNLSSGANSFQWSFGDATNSTSNNPSHTYTQSGFYTLDLIATSPYGCIDSISKATQVIEAPVAQFSTFPNSGCGPLTAQFNNQCQGVYNLYQWDLGNGGTCNTETPSNSIFHAGIHQDTSYFVTLTASNMCGIDTYTDTVTVHPSPKSNFGFSLNTQCSPAIATFANASTGQVTSQQWLFGDNTSCITTVPTPHTYTANQNTTHYQVHLISFNSCGVDTMTKTVSVQPNTVQAFFTPSSTTACAPATINFANFSNVVNNATWDFGDNNVSSTISPNHVYQQAGTYQVRLVVTDNCGIDTALATISVQAPPQLSYQLSSDTVCQGSSFSISNLSTGLANVDWNFGDNNGSTINNPIHSYQNAGSYQIQMIGVSQNLICADTLYIPIEVSPSAKAIITSNDADGCAPFTTNFVNSSTNASYYQWIYGDGSTSTNLQGSHTYQNDGTYYCQLVANNFYNCPDTTQMLVKAYPKPVSSFSLPSQIPCELPAAISISNQSSGAVAYHWDLGNNTTSIQNNPQVNYHSNGQFTIQLIATSAYSCSDTSTQTLQLDPTPEAKFSMTSNQACEFSAIEFFNQSLHATSYKWNFGDGEESIVTSPLHVYENDGEYDIKLIAYNSNLCTDTLVLKDTILIHPVPVADFTWHHLYQDDMSKGMVQFENRSVDADNFYWDFDDGENSSDNHPAHQFLSHGDYYVSLHVDNQYGCARDTTQLVHIDHVKGLFIPNAVMPTHTNPDVALFTPKGIGLQEYEIRIYDQWGNLVWMSNQLIDGQPAESWDGKKDGVILPAGTYVWKAQAIFLDGSVWRGNQISENETMKTEGLLRVIR